MPGRVQGKVVLVTGSARGLGAACATVLAREGARVVVTDILDEDGGAGRADATRRAGHQRNFALHSTGHGAPPGAMYST